MGREIMSAADLARRSALAPSGRQPGPVPMPGHPQLANRSAKTVRCPTRSSPMLPAPTASSLVALLRGIALVCPEDLPSIAQPASRLAQTFHEGLASASSR